MSDTNTAAPAAENQATAEAVLGKGGEYVSEPAHKLPTGGDAKFFDAKTGAYNWQAHAVEAEFKLSQKAGKADIKADTPALTEAPKPVETQAEVAPTEAAKEAVEKAGLDWSDLGRNISETGDIGKEAREALIKQGIDERVIDRYVELELKDLRGRVSVMLDAMGGEQGLAKIQSWLKANLTAEQITAYEERLNDPDQLVAAANELASRAGVTQAKPPLRGGGAASGDPGVKPFGSDVELQSAIRDPKYKTDPTYRAEVAQRAAASTWTNRPRFHNSGFVG